MFEGIDLWAALRQPLQALVDPAERIFLPAVLGAVVLTWALLGPRVGTGALRAGLFSARIWRHASARADITLMFVKALVFAVVRVPWLAATAAASLWLGLTLYDVFGPSPAPTDNRVLVTLVYTVVLFAAWDASRFALHILMHRVPMLWSIHQVHHGAPVLTPLTLFRVHPIESLLYDVRGLVTTALVTGVFLYLFRGTASELQLLGINALGLLFNFAGGNLRHSHVWLRFGWFERWVISPAQHQMHHGRDAHPNYGTWLAVWDRLAGTWRAAPPRPARSFGLEAPNHRPDSVLSMLVAPLLDAFCKLRPGRRFSVGVALLLVPGAARAASAPAPEGESEVAAEPDTPTPEEAEPDLDHPRAIDPVEPPAWPDEGATPEDPPIEEHPPEGDEDEDEVDFELELPEDGEEPTAQPGQTPPPDDGYDIALDQISIIGTVEQVEQAAGSAHVIDDKELSRKENDDFNRAIRGVPGVNPREEDGFGLRPNIGIRGANSDRSAKVTLMEDGILLAPAPYAAPAAYYFPLVTRIAAIEVYKGPASIRHGPNTLGGAINLITRPIPHTMEGYGDVALGMRGYGKVHGWWGTTYKRFGVLLEGARVQSNGFKELDGGGETGFDKNDFMVKLRYGSDPNRRFYHQVDVKGGFATETSYETYLGLTDDDFADTPYRRYPASQKGRMKWWRSQAEAGYYVARGTIFDLQLRAYRHDFDRTWRKFNGFRGAQIQDVLAAPDEGQTAVLAAVLRGEQDSLGPGQALLIGSNHRIFQVSGGTVVAHVRPTWRWLEQDIELGARVHHDEIVRDHLDDGYLMVAGTLVPEGTARVRTTNNRGSAIAGAFHVLDTVRIKWFSIVPGARVELIGTELNNRLTATETRAFNAVFIPGIGAHAQAAPWLGILAGVHSGFSPVAPGQPDEVKPERSINYELGARVDHRARRTHTRAEAIGFFNDYSNLTSVCTFSSGCDDTMLDRQFNAGRVFVWGLESLVAETIELPRTHYIEVSATYTYTGSHFRSSFTSDSPQLTDVERGDQLPYVPRHVLSVALGAGGQYWGVFPSLSYLSDMRDVAGQGPIPAAERIPQYYVIDVATQGHPTKRSTIYLNFHNLTNNVYMVSRRPFGTRPGLPFQLMAGFKYHFA